MRDLFGIFIFVGTAIFLFGLAWVLTDLWVRVRELEQLLKPPKPLDLTQPVLKKRRNTHFGRGQVTFADTDRRKDGEPS